MVTASGVRIGWWDLPAQVRQAVERILGGSVVEAVSQPGGFSPGTADRVRTGNGRRAFVKAVSPDQNDLSPVLHRREAVVTSALPASAPAPRLLGCHDDGHWVALVLEDVEGRHPLTPWVGDELARVLTALDQLAVSLTPSPLPDGGPATERMTANLSGWDRIAARPPADLDPWSARHLDRLCGLAGHARSLLAGGTLAHTDLRADNLLITPSGAVRVVDWPHACNGPAWLDTVLGWLREQPELS